MDETSYNVTFGGHENYAFRRTARYRDGSGRFAFASRASATTGPPTRRGPSG